MQSARGVTPENSPLPQIQTLRSTSIRSLRRLLLGGLEFHFVLFRGGLDSLPGCATLRLGDILHLVETRGGVADVRGVFQGFFALLGKCVLGRRYSIASCLIQFCHVFPPCLLGRGR